MRLRYLLLSASFLNLILSVSLLAQGYVDILPDEVKNPFFDRHKKIVSGLATAQANDWVGQYTREVGPTWSEALVWDPARGFAAFRDTCSNGPRAWVNYGGASFRDGMIVFTPERGTKDEFALDLPANEFTPVRWGKEHWLVPSDKLALFAYAVNSRSGDPYEIAYLKDDDGERRQTDRPELPKQYEQLLGLPPIRAKVVAIAETTGDWYPPMTIDAGKNNGVIEGMSFWLVRQKGVTAKVVVTQAGERTSVVEVREWGKHGPGLEKEIVPAVGWRFSSRMPSTGY